ncbi:MAG: metal ABC transporter ATP-binding protein [Desulfurococcales archaeon]|nr:metal ABC transporter ATP-binding protein [Desulfurococcales archaeon]
MGRIEIEVENVEVAYKGESVLHIERLELEGPGLVQVLGPNGAGKTTLLRLLAGLVKPRSGSIIINGVNITGNPRIAGRFLSYVPQSPPVGRYSPLTAFDTVCYSVLMRRSWPRLYCDSKTRRLVEDALSRVGVPSSHWFKRLTELSGGQLMRVFIAKSIAAGRPVILMDEPLSPVDPAGKTGLAKLIVDASKDRLVIVTSHDPMLLLDKTKTLVLVNRRVVAYGPPSVVIRREVLEEVYGSAIIPVGPSHLHIVDSHR